MTAAQVRGILVVALVCCAWIGWAEHPSARNLRRAIQESLWLT